MILLKSKLQKYGERLVRELGNQSPVASGSLKNSFSSKVVDLGGSIELEVFGSSVFKFIEFGRKAGKQPSVSSITEWIKNKGIQPYQGQSVKQAAYLIGRHIGEKGIKPKRYLQDILTKTELVFADNMIVAYGDEIQRILEKETKNI
tara:strand:+ start:1624 stop:2064 length:441 start_codon:yes stop_codon:yes gene_type:complete